MGSPGSGTPLNIALDNNFDNWLNLSRVFEGAWLAAEEEHALPTMRNGTSQTSLGFDYGLLGEHAQQLDVAPMLRLMLDQMMEHPLRRHLISRQ